MILSKDGYRYENPTYTHMMYLMRVTDMHLLLVTVEPDLNVNLSKLVEQLGFEFDGEERIDKQQSVFKLTGPIPTPDGWDSRRRGP